MTETISESALEQLLAGFTPDASSSRPLSIQKALFVARRLQERAAELQTPSERRQQDRKSVV